MSKIAKPYFIAEIANSHNGDIRLMYETIDQLNQTNVDAIKFQLFWIHDLIDKEHKEYEIYKKITFTKRDWLLIFRYLKRNNKKKIYFDIFGIKSLDFLFKNFNKIDGFKIHSSDIYNYKLIKKVSKLNKQIILSCGGILQSEIFKAVNIIERYNNKPIIFMNGFQSYPTNIKDLNLRYNFRYLNKFFPKHYVGYADHTDAKLIEKYIIPFLFFNDNVIFIEKHFTVDRYKRFEDYETSLEKKEMDQFIKIGNKIFNLFKKNANNSKFSKKELEYRNSVIKIVHAKEDILPNTILNYKNVKLIRPKNYINGCAKEIDQVINKRVIRKIKKDQMIKFSFLK